MPELYVPGKTNLAGQIAEERLTELARTMVPHLIAAHGACSPSSKDGTWADGDLRPSHLSEHDEQHRVWSGVAWRPVTSDQMVFQHPVTWMGTVAPLATSRWAYKGPHGGRKYDWPQCRYCGRAQAHDCEPADCPLCGSRQCRNSPECKVCHMGLMPGFWRGGRPVICGYSGCRKPAIAKVPRVKMACLDCITGRPVQLRNTSSYSGAASEYKQLIPLTDAVESRLAHRDSGRGWEQWKWVS